MSEPQSEWEEPVRSADPAKVSHLFDTDDAGATLLPGAELDNAQTTPQSPHTQETANTPGLAIHVPGYRVGREIGRGGQAAVFEGIQLSTGQKVAIKLLKSGMLSSPAEQRRFDREVQLLVALQHPDIVRVVDRGVTPDGIRFLVMEYIHGRPLDQFIEMERERGDWDPVRQMRLFLRIAEAVNAAHLRGIVHRDLKPANIRVDAEGNPHILDFGVARAGAASDDLSMTVTGDFIGSLPWASPEQADGLADKIDARSDVYSLGVILYQMLTGVFPYEVVGAMRDVLNNILTARPAPPSEIVARNAARTQTQIARARRVKTSTPGVSRTVEAIVLKALSKRREDRYQSAGEMARDIDNYLSNRPTLAAGKPESGGIHAWGLAAIAAVVGMLVAGGAVYFIVNRAPDARPNHASVAAQPLGPADPARSSGAIPANPPAPVNPGVPTSVVTPTEAAKVVPPPQTQPAPPTPAVAPASDKVTVSTTGGICYIHGTSGDDTITVIRRGEELAVRSQEALTPVPMAQLTSLVIDAGAGNDTVRIDDLGPISIEVNAGAGDDRITVTRGPGESAKSDRIIHVNGGPGKDALFIEDASPTIELMSVLVAADHITRQSASASAVTVQYTDMESVSQRVLADVPADVPAEKRTVTWCIAATHTDTSYTLDNGPFAALVLLGQSDEKTVTGNVELTGPLHIGHEGPNLVQVKFHDDARAEPTTYQLECLRIARKGLANLTFGRTDGVVELYTGKAAATVNLESGSSNGGTTVYASEAGCTLNVCPTGKNLDTLRNVSGLHFVGPGTMNVFDSAGTPRRYSTDIDPVGKSWRIAIAQIDHDYATSAISAAQQFKMKVVWYPAKGSKFVVKQFPQTTSMDVVAPADFPIERQLPAESIKLVQEQKQ